MPCSTEKVNETMLDMGVPEVMPSYMSVGIEPVFQEASQNGGCKITCNGKPAWFKGQLPCFGKLEVRLGASCSWKGHATKTCHRPRRLTLLYTVRECCVPEASLGLALWNILWRSMCVCR